MCSEYDYYIRFLHVEIKQNAVHIFKFVYQGQNYIVYTDDKGQKSIATYYSQDGIAEEDNEYPITPTDELINKVTAYENNLELYL